MSALLWKPLLAASLPVDADLEALPYPLWASPKLDGFRCMGQGRKGVSRKGLPFRNAAVQDLFKTCGGNLEGVDGELCVGAPWAEDCFNRTQNCANTGSEEAAEEWRRHGTYWVFARYDQGVGAPLGRMFTTLGLLRGLPKVRIVKQTLIRTAKQLEAYEAKTTAKGYEGVMLRRSDGPAYPQKPGKESRSTLREFDLVKWKRFEQAEAEIMERFPLMHNLNEEKTAAGKRSTRKAGVVEDAEGRTGSVTLRRLDGSGEFSMTVQGDKLQRWAGWADPARWRGVKVRYKYQLAGMKENGRPRVASCSFRELGV